MNAATTNDSRIQALLEGAQRAHGAGRCEDAARSLQEARLLAPNHPLVQSALAMHAVHEGDAAGARRMLEKAIAAAPQSPILSHTLALACRALGDTQAEMAALDATLALDPYFFLALLQKATLLERQGNLKQAAHFYQAVLATAMPSVQLPRATQLALAHARDVIVANNDALEVFLRARIAGVRSRHKGADQGRFDDCLAALLGRKRIYAQQPTFMHFPRLPAIEFYDRELFPWLGKIEAATSDIRSELIHVLADEAEEFIPYVANPEGTPLNQWRELNHSRRWSAFYLWRDGVRAGDHCARCPKTAAVLAELPLADVPSHAPTAFFSLLQPKTRIPPHTGVANTRLVVHLPLVVPDSCGFRVGSDIREWRPGSAWVFDDTIEHEAWNNSDSPRVILIFDVWNPFLTEAERDLVRAATHGIGDFYDGKSPAAGHL